VLSSTERILFVGYISVAYQQPEVTAAYLLFLPVSQTSPRQNIIAGLSFPAAKSAGFESPH
jgi:hypothetical protein